jgi:hypothetical protein
MSTFDLLKCLRDDIDGRMAEKACFAALLESPKQDRFYAALITAPDKPNGKYLAIAKGFDCKDQIGFYNRIKRFLNQFFIERTVLDRFGAARRLPFVLHPMDIGMGFLSLSSATKELYDLVDHGKIEITTTGFRIEIIEDGAGNWKPSGKQSDGEMVALMMAISGMLAKAMEAEQPVDPVIVQISKLDIKPDDILIVRFQHSTPDAQMERIAAELVEITGLKKVLVFDEPVDISVISPTESNE